LRDLERIPDILPLVREKYDIDQSGVARETPRGCNLAFDATSTRRDGMARAGERNHGLIVFYVLPHDRIVWPFIIHVIETDDSKLTPDVQKVGKQIVRVLRERGWFPVGDFSDADPCTSCAHRVYYSVRDAVRELLTGLRGRGSMSRLARCGRSCT
jgi:hypothetical protein